MLQLCSGMRSCNYGREHLNISTYWSYPPIRGVPQHITYGPSTQPSFREWIECIPYRSSVQSITENVTPSVWRGLKSPNWSDDYFFLFITSHEETLVSRFGFRNSGVFSQPGTSEQSHNNFKVSKVSKFITYSTGLCFPYIIKPRYDTGPTEGDSVNPTGKGNGNYNTLIYDGC
jgi:hypothetical protein